MVLLCELCIWEWRECDTYVLGTFYKGYFCTRGYERRKNCKPSCSSVLFNTKTAALWLLEGINIGLSVFSLFRSPRTSKSVIGYKECTIPEHLLHVGWRNICKLPWFLWESSVSCYLLCYSCLGVCHMAPIWFPLILYSIIYIHVFLVIRGWLNAQRMDS